jgi:glycosyltransferase involved in cell wall biosynthesis
MNILFTNPFPPNPETGGIERVTGSLISGLEKRGHTCYFLLCNKENGKIILLFKGKPVQDIGEFLRKQRIDIIINQNVRNLFFVLRYKKSNYKVKLISCFHISPGYLLISLDEAIKLDKSSSRRKLKTLFFSFYKFYIYLKSRYIDSVNYKFSDRYVLLSAGFFNDYTRFFKRKMGNKLAAISNPLSFQHSFPVDKIRDKEKIVLIVARLIDPQKRISLCLKIWEKISPALPEWKLIIVGDGPNADEYKEYVKIHAIGNVLFTGRQNSYEYYQKASIFMMTSAYEGFPMTLIEAQQMGVVPVVMDSYAALHDVVTNNKDGIIIPNNDIEGFCTAMVRCMQDNEYRFELAKAAVYSSNRFAIENILDKWEGLFNSLTANA